MIPYDIRPARTEDMSQVEEMLLEADIYDDKVNYLDMVGTSLVAVEKDTNKVVGFIHFVFGKPYSIGSTCVVHPDYRGEGLGAILLELMCDQAFILGSSKLLVTTSKTNVAVNEGLKSYGFALAGECNLWQRSK
jgi:N-acetylglutamate synthase-like GNAT family acetyltransferase